MQKKASMSMQILNIEFAKKMKKKTGCKRERIIMMEILFSHFPHSLHNPIYLHVNATLHPKRR
jgi:hypothetical protein